MKIRFAVSVYSTMIVEILSGDSSVYHVRVSDH